MSRREFPTKVKIDAFERAGGRCENPACGAKLTVGKFHYDHEIPDGLGGEPTLENCKVLCHVCHAEKTRKTDVPAIAKTKRVRAKYLGAKKKSRSSLRNEKWKRKVDGTVVPR